MRRQGGDNCNDKLEMMGNVPEKRQIERHLSPGTIKASSLGDSAAPSQPDRGDVPYKQPTAQTLNQESVFYIDSESLL